MQSSITPRYKAASVVRQGMADDPATVIAKTVCLFVHKCRKFQRKLGFCPTSTKPNIKSWCPESKSFLGIILFAPYLCLSMLKAFCKYRNSEKITQTCFCTALCLQLLKLLCPLKRLSQNIQFLKIFFSGLKYQIIAWLAHQDDNKPCKVLKTPI